MASHDIKDLHPELQPLCREFLAQCHAEKIDTFLTCTYRSNEEQEKAYAQGRTTPGKIITNARAGQSKHNFAIGTIPIPAAKAFDFAIKINDGVDWNPLHPSWQRAGEIGKALGMTWGGDWKLKDFAHMEID